MDAGQPQWPEAQIWPAAHAVPQPPQLAGSTLVSTQLWPHKVVPVPQVVMHPPIEHTWPVEHALPHLPQLAGSLESVEQTAPHRLWVAGHAEAASPVATSMALASTPPPVVDPLLLLPHPPPIAARPASPPVMAAIAKILE